MHILTVLAGTALLTGCVVASVVSSDYDYFPYVQTFQKPDTPGHTDVAQRRQDLYDCGVERSYPLDSSDDTWRRNTVREGETSEEGTERDLKIERCMKQKGYIIRGFSACGPLKKPTGLCN